VGLLTALFARKAGASDVVISDPSAFRRDAAGRLGLTALPEEEVWRYAKARWHHGGADRGADVAFQTRAHPESLHGALQALRPQGTVVDLAFYQGGSPGLRLGEEFHHNGLSIRCAQINRVPRGLGHGWDRRRLALETLDLIRWAGPVLRETLITHVVPLDDAPAFIEELIASRPEFLQIVFEVNP
jgi:threonine dehydrogenase-like Zn-dependent dehydrogenase